MVQHDRGREGPGIARFSRTPGSEYRVSFDQSLEPPDTVPQQLTFEGFVEPTS